MFSPTSPVTGSAQTGLTGPTFTLTVDTPPVPNSKQWAVTTYGGTGTLVDTHAVSKPFTLGVFRPAQLRTLGAPNPVTGVVSNVPRNNYSIVVRKGAIPLAGQAAQVSVMKLNCEVPAGTDLAEPDEIRGALSLLIGAANQQSAGFGDTLITGIL